MRKSFSLALLALLLTWCSPEKPNNNTSDNVRGSIIEAKLLATYTKAQADSILTNEFQANSMGITAQNGFSVYLLTFRSPDAKGNLVLQSGIVSLPEGEGKARSLISYQHGTVSHRDGAPSNGRSIEGKLTWLLAAMGYVGQAPDYLGLGLSQSQHLYCHGATHASSVLDMIRAVRKLCEQKKVSLSGKVSLTGYSQGGYATVAAQKEIESKYSNEFNLVAVAAGAGPYSMDQVMVNVMLSDSTHPNPAYLPFIMVTYNSYYNIVSNPTDMFVDGYKDLAGYYDGNYDIGFINNKLKGAPVSNVPIRVVNPTMIDDFKNNQNHSLRVALRENDLTNWAPKTPTRLYFGALDKDVNPDNARVAYTKWRNNGCTVVDTFNVGQVDHGGAIQVTMASALLWLQEMDQK